MQKVLIKPENEGGCWLWTAYRNPGNYGMITIKGKTEYAHRASYQLFKGSLEKGTTVRHSCDNPPCVNPAHLEKGTANDNFKDSIIRGRHSKILATKTYQDRRLGSDALEIISAQRNPREMPSVEDAANELGMDSNDLRRGFTE